MPELEDSLVGDGIDDSDYLAVVDASETDLTLANKKVRVRNLHEFVAPIESPILTGLPQSTTALVGDNSTRIATTEWVQNEFGEISLNTLSDITIPTTPQANQILVFNDLTGTFQAQSPTTVNRETLTGTKSLTSASALYQFLDPNGADRDVILPAGATGLRFVIKNLDITYNLNIKESAGGATQVQVGINSQVVECVFDSVTWQILSF